MMNLKTFAACLGFCLLLLSTAAASEEGPGLTRITESVYAYENIQPGTPGNIFQANAGIVIGDDGVLVVDTLTSADEGRALLADIRTVTDKPILYVVNTHYHPDHSLGNCVFRELGAAIIAHSSCRTSMHESGDESLAHPESYGLTADYWATTTVAVPTITFDRRMEIDLGGLTVELIHSGHASHSPGSIFVYMPDQRVVFAGDVLFTDFHPFLGEGDFEGWSATLDLLESLDVGPIIPGHGPLSSREDIADMRAYLTLFDEQATRLSAELDSVEAITAELMKILPQRNGGDFLVGYNVAVRYAPRNAPSE